MKFYDPHNQVFNPMLSCLDPVTMGPQKALELVGANLQRQYERWQPRARYRQSLDPCGDEVKKLCQTLRRNAKVIVCFHVALILLV